MVFKHLNSLDPKRAHHAELSEVLRWASAGRILPIVDRVIPIEEIAEGYRLLEDQQHFGKIVITP